MQPRDEAGQPRLSIAMATFNGARFLGPQLASLAGQSRPADEMVVCDDGSTDGTLEILEDFARHAPFPVTLVRNDVRLGYRANFMRAAGLCQGAIIAFCDQDDVWYETKLDRMARCFDDPDVALAYHDYDLIDAEARVYAPAPSAEPEVFPALSQPPTWNNPQGFTMLWRRELLAFNAVFALSRCKAEPDQIAGHDQWISYLASSFGRTVHVRRALAGYRQHGGNVFGHSDADADPRQQLRLLHAAVDAFRACLARAELSPWPTAAALRMNGRYARSLHMRLQALASPDLRTRLIRYLQLCLTGAYLRPSWPLGRRALVKDPGFVLGLR